MTINQGKSKRKIKNKRSEAKIRLKQGQKCELNMEKIE